MNELQKDISNQALQINAIGRVKLTNGQSGLLKAIRNCVQNKTSLNWDIIVDVYYENVSKNQRSWKFANDSPKDYTREWFLSDIKECYIRQDSKWQYTIKPKIRQWFVSTIGILVIKNQLIIIPTIEMD